MSEWAREVLLRELDGGQARPAEQTLLAEVLALRTILLNLHFTVAKGQAITAEEMQAIIDRADQDTAKRAAERLAAKLKQLKKKTECPALPPPSRGRPADAAPDGRPVTAASAAGVCQL